MEIIVICIAVGIVMFILGILCGGKSGPDYELQVSSLKWDINVAKENVRNMRGDIYRMSKIFEAQMDQQKHCICHCPKSERYAKTFAEQEILDLLAQAKEPLDRIYKNLSITK